MDWWGRIKTVVGATLVLVVLALVVGQLLGQPVLLSYVTSGSMEPTIDTGDGFVAIPTAVAGPVEEGDVVVFKAEEVNGGRLTTHRVVRETDRGYITRGDANPFTDQANGEPPVKRTQVVSKALEVGGSVVVVPHLGTVAEGSRSVVAALQRQLAGLLGMRSLLGVQGLAYLLFALSIVAYTVDVIRDSGGKERQGRDRSRSTGTDARVLVGALALLVVLSATAAMVGPSGAQQYDVVSAEFESERPDVIETGTSKTSTVGIPNGGLVPVMVFLEPGSDSIGVEPRELRIDGRDQVNASVTLSAPRETGYYRRSLVQHRYLAVLPESTIRALYEVHQWLPILAIDVFLGVPFYLLGVRLVGTGRVRRRTREAPTRLARLLDRYS
jgi:signal peptidase